MKKILFALCVIAGIGAVSAQDNLLQFFPNEEGSQLVSKCYDANDVYQGSMIMTVAKDYEYVDGEDMDINYVLTDAQNNVLSQGKIDAQYRDGNFYMDMKSRALSPTVGQYVSTMSEISGDFLDYPNLFPDPMRMETDFQMDGGEFSIRSADNKKDVVTVRKYGRQIEGTESITTPAGTYDATKISFNVEVSKDRERTTYHGVEWYSPGAGIVRSEIYDGHKNLLDYTVLAEMNLPHKR